ncbi:CheW domain-containing protein [Leptothoe spongobia]|uniref:CheW domain-containing protein n=1 Tax=Leptothoe spongobia TAU-MAC 1115 TaxID=1967444 RepID=A0A947DEZ7_9CYAN|nr:CheW domain-containing protein [Leptothoe spongobia]MBT9315439.1 CheW domain-containing protein [Leptothoe spongobia TAU-MAC 1115]
MQLSAQELPQSSAVTQFLKFNLSSDMTALLPVRQLVAVLKIEAAKITAIPHLSPWVMGVYNWRGEVLWIVDTSHLLGVSSWQQQAMLATRYDILLLEKLSVETTERCFLGLWVRQVEGIELLSLDSIQSPAAVSESLVPFLRGYWLNPAGDMLSLLDGPAIFDRMSA